MKLYLLELLIDENENWYDKTLKVAVIASSEDEAREITSLNAQAEGGSVWFDKSVTSCEHIELNEESKGFLIAHVAWA